MIAPDVKINFEQFIRDYEFNIAAKNEVINQLNSMYKLALDNKQVEVDKLKKQNKFMQDQLLNVAQFLDNLALLIDEHSKIQGELNASQKENQTQEG